MPDDANAQLTPAESGALVEKLLARDPKTGAENLAILQEFRANAESRLQGFPPDSPEHGETERVCNALSICIRQQIAVNDMAGDLKPEQGGFFCIPPEKIVSTGPVQKLFGEKPLTLEEFQQKYQELKSQIQEKAAQVIRESTERMKQELGPLREKVNMVISREKSTIEGAVKDRKDSGWFGGLSRGVTLSDPYQVEINKARQKVGIMQDVALPMLKEAEAALATEPPNLTLAREKMEAVQRMRGTMNKVDTDQSHFQQEQEALTVTQNVSIAVIVTLPTLGVGGSSMIGGKAAWEGTKLAYHGLSTGLTYATVGTAVAGGATELIRGEKEASPAESEKASERGNQMKELAEMPPEQRMETIANQILDKIPHAENYNYSEALLGVAVDKAKMIGGKVLDYVNEPDVKKREAILTSIVSGIESSAADLMSQFLKDNVDPTTAKRFEEARADREKNDTLRIGSIVGQMEMLEPLSRGDRNAAMEAAKKYVRNNLVGVQEQDVPPADTIKVLDEMAANLLNVTETQTYPLLIKSIQAYSKTGFSKSFSDKLGGVANFVGDVVTSPFNEESQGRLGKGYEAVSTIVSQGKVGDVASLVMNFAKTACNISMDHVQALDMLETLGGSMALDALIIVGTAGVGMGAKAAQESGKITAGTANVFKNTATGVSVANSALNNVAKPYSYAAPITLSGLNQAISSKVKTPKAQA